MQKKIEVLEIVEVITNLYQHPTNLYNFLNNFGIINIKKRENGLFKWIKRCTTRGRNTY